MVGLKSRDVEVASDNGRHFSCYMAAPGTSNGAVVLVLQEIFGVNANIRAVADRFAAAGYLALCPDLFWRLEPGVQLDPADPAARERATALMKRFDPEQAVEDAYAALQFAQSQTQASMTAAVGFCLGGKLAYLLAARKGIAKAVSYYGVGIQGVLGEATSIKRDILLHIAAEDHLCPPEAQEKIKAAMAPLGSRASVITHPGVGHAFARQGGTGFDAAAAERADSATMRFLQSGPGVPA